MHLFVINAFKVSLSSSLFRLQSFKRIVWKIPTFTHKSLNNNFLISILKAKVWLTWRPTWASLLEFLLMWHRWPVKTPWNQCIHFCPCQTCETHGRKTVLHCHWGKTACTCQQTWEVSAFHWDSLAWTLCTIPWLCFHRIGCGTLETPGPLDSSPAYFLYTPFCYFSWLNNPA